MRLNHYRNGHGEPLVLIHGLGSQWQMWEPVFDRLMAHRDVIALDLPGFGASPMPPPGTPPGPASLTSLVQEFLDELGVVRPHVAGNSLGGLVALELARRGAVASCDALSPAGFANRVDSTITHGVLWGAVRAARRVAPRAGGLARTATGRKLLAAQFMRHPERMTPAETAGSVRALAGAPWFDATLPTIGADHFTGGAGIAVPVTVAWGQHDRVLFPRQARRAAAAIPQARMVTLHGCGHVPTWDDPEQVARVLLESSGG